MNLISSKAFFPVNKNAGNSFYDFDINSSGVIAIGGFKHGNPQQVNYCVFDTAGKAIQQRSIAVLPGITVDPVLSSDLILSVVFLPC